MQARAAVMYEVNKPLVVEELEVLDPGPHEVRVRFAANGVCHSDLHVMTGDYPYPLPVVLGHEAAGVVDAIGAGVESVKLGDHTQPAHAHRQLVRRRPPADRRPHVDRSVHGRAISPARADQPAAAAVRDQRGLRPAAPG